MENPNKFLGKLVNIKHLNEVGTIISQSDDRSFVVSRSNGQEGIYLLSQLSFLNKELNSLPNKYTQLSVEEVKELIMEQNEQK